MIKEKEAEVLALCIYIYIHSFSSLSCGPGSVVVATAYGLDGPGIESRWGGGEIFCTCPDQP
jgi:hypothetical protein